MDGIYYILDEEDNPKEAVNIFEWCNWFSKNLDKRVVSKTTVENLTVSTVFLGVNYTFDEGIPLLYESMVFDENDKPFQFDKVSSLQKASIEEFGFDFFGCSKRYATKTGAIEGHNEIVFNIKKMFDEISNL